MKLILVRGPAGSGKAKISVELGGIRNRTWFDPDFYWYVLGNGHYIFVPNKVDKAAEWCFEKCKAALEARPEVVIITSTDPTLESVETYQQLAEEYGYEFDVLRAPGPWRPETLTPKHRIPGRVLRRQIDQYEPHEAEKQW